jgi:hypothetical protein
MAVSVLTDVVVPCRADLARARLDGVLGRAVSERGRIRVGPRRRRWPTRQVSVRMGDSRIGERTSLADLTWAPEGRLRRCFPVLQAEVAVTSMDDTSCLLTIAGDYQPPFGGVGRLADRALLHRMAVSTTKDFADRLAAALARDNEIARHREGLP